MWYIFLPGRTVAGVRKMRNCGTGRMLGEETKGGCCGSLENEEL